MAGRSHRLKIPLTSFRGARREVNNFFAAACGSKVAFVRALVGLFRCGLRRRSVKVKSGDRGCSISKRDRFTVYVAVLP